MVAASQTLARLHMSTVFCKPMSLPINILYSLAISSLDASHELTPGCGKKSSIMIIDVVMRRFHHLLLLDKIISFSAKMLAENEIVQE